jgi:DNA-binding XRE family transcriptional regulator
MATLRTLRKERSFSQRGLAEKTGLRLETVYFIETGRRAPRLQVMRLICEVLQVKPDEVDEFRPALN